MPNITGNAQIQIRNYYPTTSRYAGAEIVYYNGKLTMPLYRRKRRRAMSDDKYYEIAKDVEFRPDLVSYRLWGLPDYWWKIMEINGMKDILEFRAGKVIIIPSGSLMF